MGVVTSLVVVAVGAILRYATNVRSSTFDIRTIGDILMIVGVVGFVMSVLALFFWDGLGAGGVVRRRRTTVRQEQPRPGYGPDGQVGPVYGDGRARAAYGDAYGPTAYDPTRRPPAGPAMPAPAPAPASAPGAWPAGREVDPTRQFRPVVEEEEEERSVY